MGKRFLVATLMAVLVAAAFPAVHAAGLRLRGGKATIVWKGSRDVATMNLDVPRTDVRAEEREDTSSLQLTGVPSDVVLRLRVRLAGTAVTINDLQVFLTAHEPCPGCATLDEAGIERPFDHAAPPFGDTYNERIVAGPPVVTGAPDGAYGDGAEFPLDSTALASVQSTIRNFGLLSGLRFGLTVEAPDILDADATGAGLRMVALYPPENALTPQAGLLLQQDDGHLSDWVLSGNRFVEHTALRSVPASWRLIGSGDADRDGDADLYWHEQNEGWLAVWTMDGNRLVSGDYITPHSRVGDPNWKLRAIADLDGDGSKDLVWQNINPLLESVVIWFMNGRTFLRAESLRPSPRVDRNWHFVGGGDANGDGKDDLFLQHQLDGRVGLWIMDGSFNRSGGFLTPGQVPIDWKIRAVKDLNRDGRPDLLLQNTATGALARWLMNGGTRIDEALLTPADVGHPRWRLAAVR